MRFYTLTAALLSVLLVTSSCQQDSAVERIEVPTPTPRFVELPAGVKAKLGKSNDGATYELYMAEYLTAEGSDEMGNVVVFNDRGNKQLTADFAPGTTLDGTDAVSFYVDQNRPTSSVPVSVSTAAIERAMGTWDGVTCSELDMFQVPSDGRPTGFVSALFGFGGSFAYVADLNHAGWLPAFFFDILAPNGSRSILGVAFTIIQIDPVTGDPLDANNDGKTDVAWREIYYNDNFPWVDGTTGGVDIETVALHEAGHGLSQAHFGKGFRKNNGGFQFAPRAVMNAAYTGIQTEINGSDNGGHCSNWASWPQQ